MDFLHQLTAAQPDHPVSQLLGPSLPALFTGEGEEFYDRAYQHNQAFAQPGPYDTRLSPADEKQFRQWVKDRGVPFNPDAARSDYDMRGFWQGEPALVKQWQTGKHFPDTYKTPYDTTFSGESKYAKPGTPFVWQGDRLIDQRNGRVIYAPAPKEQ